MFMYQKQNETTLLNWTEPHGPDRLFARLKVETAAQHELTRADAFTRDPVWTHMTLWFKLV